MVKVAWFLPRVVGRVAFGFLSPFSFTSCSNALLLGPRFSFCLLQAHPIGDYPARCTAGAALMHMVMNNLDPAVAQFPHELITYGGNGAAFSNWAQYRLTMK